MDENLNRPDPLNNFILAVIVALTFSVWLVLIGSQIYFYEPANYARPITKEEVVAMGQLNNEHAELISKIRADLKITEETKIKIFIGPYFYIFGYATNLIFLDPPECLIFIDENFYRSLGADERIAIVAHEIGHLTNKHVPNYQMTETIMTQYQIEADTYATKYIEPEVLIKILNKTVPFFDRRIPEYKLRIENLERIKRTRQAH